MDNIILDSTVSNVIGFRGKRVSLKAQLSPINLVVDRIGGIIHIGSIHYEPFIVEFNYYHKKSAEQDAIMFFGNNIQIVHSISHVSPSLAQHFPINYKFDIHLEDQNQIAKGCYVRESSIKSDTVLGKKFDRYYYRIQTETLKTK